MKKYRVKISSLALRDMEEIYGYISEKLGSPATAIKQYERIAEAIESLNVFSGTISDHGYYSETAKRCPAGDC